MSMIAEMRQGWGAITGRAAPGPERSWLRERGSAARLLVWGVGAPAAAGLLVVVLRAAWGM